MHILRRTVFVIIDKTYGCMIFRQRALGCYGNDGRVPEGVLQFIRNLVIFLQMHQANVVMVPVTEVLCSTDNITFLQKICWQNLRVQDIYVNFTLYLKRKVQGNVANLCVRHKRITSKYNNNSCAILCSFSRKIQMNSEMGTNEKRNFMKEINSQIFFLVPSLLNLLIVRPNFSNIFTAFLLPFRFF